MLYWINYENNDVSYDCKVAYYGENHMTQLAEPVEAVILSGPCRGEIVHLSVEALAVVSPEDIRKFNEALNTLVVAIERLANEVRATNEMFTTS